MMHEVAAASSRPGDAFKRIRAVEDAKSIDELEEDYGCERLWAQLRAAFQKMRKGQFEREVMLKDELLNKQNKFLNESK